MLEINDPVKIIETGEIGYVEEISESGERLKVRIPATERWPFNHYTYVTREKVHRATKSKKEVTE
jgi:hypothetical protein